MAESTKVDIDALTVDQTRALWKRVDKATGQLIRAFADLGIESETLSITQALLDVAKSKQPVQK